jgi:hypothetical protein
MSGWVRVVSAAVGMGGLLLSGCGQASSPAPSNRAAQLFACSLPDGTSVYELLDAPRAGCQALVSGKDYADGRVIIGLKPGTADSQLGPALAAHQASVVSSLPSLSDKVLAVPKGTVPQAVVGLARYPFIAFAAPDLIAHTNMTN